MKIYVLKKYDEVWYNEAVLDEQQYNQFIKERTALWKQGLNALKTNKEALSTAFLASWKEEQKYYVPLRKKQVCEGVFTIEPNTTDEFNEEDFEPKKLAQYNARGEKLLAQMIQELGSLEPESLMLLFERYGITESFIDDYINPPELKELLKNSLDWDYSFEEFELNKF